MKSKHVLIWLVMASVLTACSAEPEPIDFGNDQCHFCKMTIADPKFGGELVTDKGRVYKFDAVECMVPFMNEQEAEYAHVLAVPYDDPKSLHLVEEMHFVISDSIRSPMGANLLVFKSTEKANEYATRIEPFDWKGIQEHLVHEEF